MPDELVAAFVHTAAVPNTPDWSQAVGWGDRLANGRRSTFVELERAASAELFAAFDGALSVRPPPGSVLPRPEAGSTQRPSADGTPLTLYLVPNLIRQQSEFATFERALSARFLDAHEFAAGPAVGTGVIQAVVYRNVDAAAAKAALAPMIKQVKGSGSEDVRWARFLSAAAGVAVTAGTPIGAAAAFGNTRRVGLAVQTRFGCVDPGAFFDDAAAIARQADAASLRAFRDGLVPRVQALIAPNAAPDRIEPWVALLEHRRARNLSDAEWRALGDGQKALYRAQLVRRTRPTAQDNGPRFEFDGFDMANVFQLEAVAEFYLNFRDPWIASTQPTAPGMQGYHTVDLLQPRGSRATVAGATVTLDGGSDLSRVTVGRDTLELYGSNTLTQHRVVGVDRQAGTLAVDPAPQPGANLKWELLSNPTLILIDAFGSRVRGANADRTAASTVTLATLDDAQLEGLKRVNAGSDTIAFPAAAPGQRSVFRIAALTIAGRTATLALDADPTIPAATGWAIPAGVGGTQGTVEWPSRKQNRIGTADWWDNYDGLMALVAHGELVGAWPWSSLSSRKEGYKYRSSVAGNRPYRFISFTSAKHNSTFKVMDPGGLRSGVSWRVAETNASRTILELDNPLDGATYSNKVGWSMFLISAAPPRFVSIPVFPEDPGNPARPRVKVLAQHVPRLPTTPTGYWIEMHDAVREAAWYFEASVTPDVAPPNVVPGFNPAATGKGGIRMHRGYINGSGSQGCLVSPYFWAMRSAMAVLHQRANRDFHQQPHGSDAVGNLNSAEDPPPELVRFLAMNRQIKAYQAEIAAWTDRLNLVDEVAREEANPAAADNLRAEIESLRASMVQREDDGDEVTGDRVAHFADHIAESIAATGDAEELRADLQTVQRERVAHVRARIATLKADMDAESRRVGWTHAVQGVLLIVRPDQRPPAP